MRKFEERTAPFYLRNLQIQAGDSRWQDGKTHGFESASDPENYEIVEKDKSRQHARTCAFWVENSCFEFWGGKWAQLRGFWFGENFEAQTWVEHAIFALRERRLTTWPLRHDTSTETIKRFLRQPQCFLNRFFEYCWRQHNCLNSLINKIPQYY